MPNVLLTNFYAAQSLELIRQSLPEGLVVIPLDEASKRDVVAKAVAADYLLVGGRIPIDKEVIDHAPRLRMVQRTGVGMDGIDLSYLAQRRIPVYVNPGVNAGSVAEHTLLLMLAVLRQLVVADASIRQGQWLKHPLGNTCHTLQGKTVALIGVGHIGQAVARLLGPFDVRALYFDQRRLAPQQEAALRLTYRPFQDLLAEADILTLHCPLSDSTRHLIDCDSIAHMKPGAILINTARGQLVDEAALVDALVAGRLAGAGLDVYGSEPPSADSPLLRLKNVVLTPHMAGLTMEAFCAMMREAFANIKAFDDGRLADIEARRVHL